MLNLLYLLIPIFLLVLLLTLYFWVNSKKEKLDISFKKYKEESDSTTNHIYSSDLRSLSIIKNKEKDTNEIVEKAATMVYQIDKLKKVNHILSIQGKEKTDKYQLFSSNKLLVEIKNNEEEIKKVAAAFTKTVGPILGNIKTIREEIVFYKNGLRDFNEKFGEITSSKHSPKSFNMIENELSKIRNKLGELDDLVDSSDLDNAVIVFSDVKNDFLSLINFANSSEKLEKTIFTEIPLYINKLKQLFSETKNNTGCELVFLSFDEQVFDLQEMYILLIEAFTINTITLAEKLCREMLTLMQNLNTEINHEINSFSFIKKNEKEIYKHKNDISKYYLLLKDEFKIAGEIDKIYFSQFDDEVDSLLNYLTEVDIWIKEIEELKYNYDVSFSSKKFKYKSLYYQLKGFYLLYVELKKKIEIFYLEGESNLLKFERLSILFRVMNAYVKNNDIILNIKEKQNVKNIETIRQNIISIILTTSDDIAPMILNEYNNILLELVTYVKTVGLKIEISKLFKQTVKMLSHKRSSDTKLNECIILSENHYLEGSYKLALDQLINSITKGVN